jgi:THO complex subunit 4
VIPTNKTLAERTTQPKAQPKSAASKPGANSGKGGVAKGAAAAAKGRRARSAKPTKKTAEELDSDMADYFGGAPPAENAGAAPAPAAAAASGDAAMEDEIM